MGTVEAIVGRFPIDILFLIMASGLFLVFSFPFDICQPLTNGVPQPSLNSARIPDSMYVQSCFGSLSIYIRGNFEPFVSIRYLNDFPNGLIKILLLSFPAGLVIYFLGSIYEKANHLVKHPRDSWNELRRWRNDRKSKKTEKGEFLSFERIERLRDSSEFSDWVTEKGHRRYYDFVFSLAQVTTGLLYASETLFLLTVLSAFFANPFWDSATCPYPAERISVWLVASFVISLISLAVYIIYGYTFRRNARDLLDTFKAEKAYSSDYTA